MSGDHAHRRCQHCDKMGGRRAGNRGCHSLLEGNKLVAPDLFIAECANILWKKVRRKGLSLAEGRFAAMLIESAEIELVEMRPLLQDASQIAFELDHPAYDCMYLALAVRDGCSFITADGTLVRKIRQSANQKLQQAVRMLGEPF
ncbi:type II toxin-antitoxin system VapC family toxin [Rhizobium puerariae]|uniref:Type II toxin-antitoxin system VapC family toxin n=1 Tax=Rhizobium puerariae TaxID=1585791 RepID=A0ABV6AKY9_9HYPH